MLDKRKYLIEAHYSWIVDSSCVPYILVMVKGNEGIPAPYVKNGKIVLNIAMSATKDIRFMKDYVSFGMRFSGKHCDVMIPYTHIAAIYARENGEGLFLDTLADVDINLLPARVDMSNPPEDKKPEPPKKPTFKVVK